jgi:hypothetical protein
MAPNPSGLKRSLNPMPEFIRHALETQDLMTHYQARPAYQQNDYIGWICRAKRQETIDKLLAQMLRELRDGGVYMNMSHPASMPHTPRPGITLWARRDGNPSDPTIILVAGANACHLMWPDVFVNRLLRTKGFQ